MEVMRLNAGLAAVAGAVLWSAAWPACAQVAPDADRALRGAGAVILGSPAFSVEVTAVLKVEAEGMKQEFTSRTALAVKRPAQVSSVLTYGFLGGTVVCDGRKVYRYLPLTKRFTEEDAPKSLAALDLDREVALVGSAFPLIAALLADDPAGAMLAGATDGARVGVDAIEGRPCARLRFGRTESSWDAWVEAGPTGVLRRVVMDLSGLLGEGGAPVGGIPPGIQGLKAELRLELAKWDLAADLKPGTFAFQPPPGSVKGASLLGEEMLQSEHPLLDKAAPDFRLPTLPDGDFTLGSQTGRVVLLEFWATWCQACRTALPEVVRMADALRDRGLVFRGVAVGETRERASAYLAAQGLRFQTVLDERAEAAGRYGVEGLPTTVVVDAAGRVRHVAVGHDPESLAGIRERVEALLGTAPRARARDPGFP